MKQFKKDQILLISGLLVPHKDQFECRASSIILLNEALRIPSSAILSKTIDDVFHDLKIISYGGVAAVVLAQFNAQKVVLKVMNSTSNIPIDIIKTHVLELHLLRYLNKQKVQLKETGTKIFLNQCIIQLIDSITVEENNILVLQYCKFGDLSQIQRFRPFSIQEILHLAAELIVILWNLHKFVIFNDLKAENVLLNDSGHPVLIDFGFASLKLSEFKANAKMTQECELDDDIQIQQFFQRVKVDKIRGTPGYADPELSKGKKSDFYSLGVLIFKLLFNRLPEVQDQKVAIPGISHSKQKVPGDLADFLQLLLQKSAKKRIYSKEKVKSHPVFAKMEWKGLFQEPIVRIEELQEVYCQRQKEVGDEFDAENVEYLRRQKITGGEFAV